jgi:aminoglycoside phosphotransferase (APT) family kinase protein
MTAETTLEAAQAAIVRAFPGLAGAVFTAIPRGWDSFAVDVDDRLIFKFPRHDAARAALVKEAAVLAIVRPAVSLPTPELRLHAGPPLFSRHDKLRGDYLEPSGYAVLNEPARERLAEVLALFYAQLHALPRDVLRAGGAGPIKPWLEPDEILKRTWPVLTKPLRRYAKATIAAWLDAGRDPYGETYGLFDGHGWNMAFDAAAQRLNGVYDFGDSGFGPLHQDFIYATMVSPDLRARIIGRYEGLTGRSLDRDRIARLFGVLRLSELAELAHDPEWFPAALESVRQASEG